MKPDFKDVRKLKKAIKDTGNVYKSIFADKEIQENNIKHYCNVISGAQARKELSSISVKELKNAKAGIRVQALADAGFSDLGKIASASDSRLSLVDGIGEKQIGIIREVVTDFANSLSSHVAIRLDPEEGPDYSSDNCALITALYSYRLCEDIRRESAKGAENLDLFYQKIQSSGMIKNTVQWMFAPLEKRNLTIQMVNSIYEFCNSAFFEKMLGRIDEYQAKSHVLREAAMEAFRKNSADFYATLEALGNATGNKPFVYDNLPARLALEVSETGLDLSGFNGNLRSYQAFGTKYVLCQKKVLLGDEMGLGKTIQAIAAMSHIMTTSDKKCFFLVVCPASVLINWAREIGKFCSGIETYIIHGRQVFETMDIWQESGGCAITNYETIGKIVDRIDNCMGIDLLVIDEAHYMKNPDAKRTMYIRRLDNESERILLMTGTPLENRVSEMCNLIEFVRPDMSDEIRSLAHISHLPQFKEVIAPVYIRRTREQVLKELPPINEESEWCSMTYADKESYRLAVAGGNFSDMRRVSFLQDDMSLSAKYLRLSELIEEAMAENRKVIVYSYFRETIAKVSAALGSLCIGVISGETDVEDRQKLVDRFSDAPGGSVLVSQIVAGGVGLNIQAASIVVFCEPQIKPSLEAQALSRVYRMGQVRNVLVYRLLCPETIDDYMVNILEEKQIEFDNFADESVVAGAYDHLMSKEWINTVIEKEKQKYLPMVI